jgi:hypothetical protein
VMMIISIQKITVLLVDRKRNTMFHSLCLCR